MPSWPGSASRWRTAPSKTTSTTTRPPPGSSPSSQTAPRRTARTQTGPPIPPPAREASTSSPASTTPASTAPGPSPSKTAAAASPAHPRPAPPPTAPSPPDASLAAVLQHGTGRIAVLADSDLFGDDCIGELDNSELWMNLVYWVGQPAFGGLQTVTDSTAANDRRWAELKEAVEELRASQEPDGAVDLS